MSTNEKLVLIALALPFIYPLLARLAMELAICAMGYGDSE